jgi:cytochrome c peroxidase
VSQERREHIEALAALLNAKAAWALTADLTSPEQNRLFATLDSTRQRRVRIEADHAALSDPDVAALGPFAVTLEPTDIGRYRTPTLRNVALVGPAAVFSAH